MILQAAVRLVYPAQCISCDAEVTTDFGLCAACWRETPFLSGLLCDQCGSPMQGEENGKAEVCDDCLAIARPWVQGRAALRYDLNARKLVLSLKHGDRVDLARPAAQWLLRAAQPLLRADMLVAPVPLHWQRLFWRRYNQSALLSRSFARLASLQDCPDLLMRPRPTGSQEGKSRDGRFANMQGALKVHPRRKSLIVGRHVLVVDDVMTSGATFAAAAEACLAAGASAVSVLALARVTKER